jgi:hypothetical protein
MRRLVVAGLAAIAVACSPAEVKLTPEQIAAESQKLTDYLNAEFEEELAMSPEALTRLGRRDQYDKLDDYSEDEVRAQLEPQSTDCRGRRARRAAASWRCGSGRRAGPG